MCFGEERKETWSETPKKQSKAQKSVDCVNQLSYCLDNVILWATKMAQSARALIDKPNNLILSLGPMG